MSTDADYTCDFPKIGELITADKAIRLASHFGMTYLFRRIALYHKDWVFDGCSGLPDKYMGMFTGCEWTDITYLCCLPHDLAYAYGDPGNEAERAVADRSFYRNLTGKADMSPAFAKVFLLAVKVGGAEHFGQSFSWGFARKEGNKMSAALIALIPVIADGVGMLLELGARYAEKEFGSDDPTAEECRAAAKSLRGLKKLPVFQEPAVEPEAGEVVDAEFPEEPVTEET